jgi:post-segregation antitoxin (ccd killing protein)
MKRRITVTVDEDLVEAAKLLGAKSLSAAVNAALREKVDGEMHRRAVLAWLEELDTKHGKASDAEQTEIEEFLDEIGFGTPGPTDTATHRDADGQ